MDRKEHLQWCKDRANAYLNAGDIVEGITSMMSDLSKHPETEVDPMFGQLALLEMMNPDLRNAKKFVNGFH